MTCSTRGTVPGRLRVFRGAPAALRKPYGPGWALVGDAGWWKDPLSTHGITDALRDACLEAVHETGLTPVGELFHRFAPAPGQGDRAPPGITGVVLLAESHLAVHTWPELGAATLDVYVCNLGADNSARAEALLAALVATFAPTSVERHAIERGRAPAMQA